MMMTLLRILFLFYLSSRCLYFPPPHPQVVLRYITLPTDITVQWYTPAHPLAD